jgi:uncharacterized protein YbjQ (UPF0145 family)
MYQLDGDRLPSRRLDRFAPVHWQAISRLLNALAVLGANAVVELTFRSTNHLIRQTRHDTA